MEKLFYGSERVMVTQIIKRLLALVLSMNQSGKMISETLI